MTDDSLPPSSPDCREAALRIFSVADVDDSSQGEGIEPSDVRAFVEGEELPEELVQVASELRRQAQSLAAIYPAGAPQRRPLTEAAVDAACEASADAATAQNDGRPTAKVPSSMEGVVPRAAAAIGLTSLVVAAVFYAGRPDSTREALSRIEKSDGSAALRPTVASDAVASPEISPGTALWSLADDRDYRRLEGFLRDRSEPEREAALDLLHEVSLTDDDEATIRIAF